MNNALDRPFTLRQAWKTRSAAVLMLLVAFSAPDARAFGFQEVVAEARALAERSYEAREPVPEFMRELDYDAYRNIRFDPRERLWRGADFQVGLVPPGHVLGRPVKLNVVDAEGVHEVGFRKDYFTFPDPKLAKRVPSDLGFAGFKLTFPLNRPDVRDEILVFAGASYFRALGKGNAYGLSGRGAAIDTGLITGEEFPAFTEFWLVRPAPDADTIDVYALLDSRRLTGAYRFRITPGETTTMAVKAVLFTRDEIELLGIAPLTSMFFYGENTARPTGQWRPEVHDSDGLAIHNGTGEWLWRPVLNPRELLVQTFQVQDPRGFGLLQRDRRFGAYEDPEARYDQRPGAWVEIADDWGKGRVVLVQIPTPDETNDNIVAFWSPEGSTGGGERLELDYRLHFGGQPVPGERPGRAVNTFVGLGDVMGGGSAQGAYRFIADFHGGPLSGLPADAAVKAVVTPQAGTELIEHYVEYVPGSDVWRLSLLARPADGAPAMLRAFLQHEEKAVTETWVYELPQKNSLRGARR